MQGNEELKKRQMLSAQIDLNKFNKGDFIKATEEEKKQQDVMGESTTFFKDGMKRLKKNPLAMGSIVILVLILALIIIAPFFVPYSYSDIITVDGKLYDIDDLDTVMDDDYYKKWNKNDSTLFPLTDEQKQQLITWIVPARNCFRIFSEPIT